MYIVYCMYIQGECTSKINYAFYNVLRVLCFDVIFYFPAALFILYYTICCDYRVYARAIVHTLAHAHARTHTQENTLTCTGVYKATFLDFCVIIYYYDNNKLKKRASSVY